MKKYFVMADVHGFYKEMQIALNKEGFDINNENHILVVCGDLFDRGSQAKEVFNFVKSLGDRFVYVRGNHEDLLSECLISILNRKTPATYHFSNGTINTLKQFCGIDEKRYFFMSEEEIYTLCMGIYEMFNFIADKAVDYFEVGDNICVHGWIPEIQDWRNASSELWEKARWTNGMDAWKRGIREPNKTIYCGHWACSYGWSHIDQKRKEFPPKNRKNWQASFEPWIKEGIVALDACTAYSGFCNCVTFEV